jgi:hypothetical protein
MPIREICSPISKPTPAARPLVARPVTPTEPGSQPRGFSPGAYSDPGNPKREAMRRGQDR